MNISSQSRRARGFTVIELLVVIVILCILGTLVGLAYSGVQTKNRNSERQATVDIIKAQLELYFAGTSMYPNLDAFNDSTWRTQNLKKLPANILQDPNWDSTIAACTKAGKPVAVAKPTDNCYSYQVTSADGSPCDNSKTACVHYTLTANLEGGEKYIKSSLN